MEQARASRAVRANSQGEAGKDAANALAGNNGEGCFNLGSDASPCPGARLQRRDSWSGFMETSSATPDHVIAQQQQEMMRAVGASRKSKALNGPRIGGRPAGAVDAVNRPPNTTSLPELTQSGPAPSASPGLSRRPSEDATRSRPADDDTPLTLDRDTEEPTMRELGSGLERLNGDSAQLRRQMNQMREQMSMVVETMTLMRQQMMPTAVPAAKQIAKVDSVETNQRRPSLGQDSPRIETIPDA